MSLIAKSPFVPQSDLEIKFETYRYYLDCFCREITKTNQNWRVFAQHCFRCTNRLQGLQNIDLDWIGRWTKISWNTEYLLSEGAPDTELIRINNQWKPIQAYYSLYSCGEAVAYIIDGNKADGHHKTLKKITEFFVKMKISPWDKAFKGAKGKSRDEHFAVNFPDDIEIPHNLKRMGVSPLSMIAKCLKAEHNHRIDETYNKQPGFLKYRYDPGYTGLLHFLYRLRVKSNYKDVGIFISKAPDAHIKNFSISLYIICFYTLVLFEILLIRKCRKKTIIELAEKYLEINPKAMQLERRINFYKDKL